MNQLNLQDKQIALLIWNTEKEDDAHIYIGKIAQIETGYYFVNVEPPTFVLWYTNDIQRSMKPFSTKLIVSIHRNGKGVQVKASVYSNKGFLLTLILILVSLPIQLYRSFDLKTLLIHMLFLLAIATWDYWAKVSAIKELETIIL